MFFLLCTRSYPTSKPARRQSNDLQNRRAAVYVGRMTELLIERTTRERQGAKRTALSFLTLCRRRPVVGMDREQRILLYQPRAARRLPLFEVN